MKVSIYSLQAYVVPVINNIVMICYPALYSLYRLRFQNRQLKILDLDNLKAPIKMCQCGHSFCDSCLVAHAGRAASWACPKCREVTNSTVEALSRNFDLENLVESLDNAQIQPKPIAEFGYCDRHQAAIKLRKHIWYILSYEEILLSLLIAAK